VGSPTRTAAVKRTENDGSMAATRPDETFATSSRSPSQPPVVVKDEPQTEQTHTADATTQSASAPDSEPTVTSTSLPQPPVEEKKEGAGETEQAMDLS